MVLCHGGARLGHFNPVLLTSVTWYEAFRVTEMCADCMTTFCSTASGKTTARCSSQAVQAKPRDLLRLSRAMMIIWEIPDIFGSVLR